MVRNDGVTSRSGRALALLSLSLGALAGAAGCVGRQKLTGHVGAGVQLDEDGARGGEVSTSGEVHGVGLSARVHAEQLARDEPELPGFVRRKIGGGADLGLRLSLFGMFSKDHRLERWFDVGMDAAVGGGFVKPARLESFGRAWVGGWAVFGLFPGNPFPSLVLDVRRIAISGWDNATMFTIGLAYSSRRIEDFSVRD